MTEGKSSFWKFSVPFDGAFVYKISEGNFESIFDCDCLAVLWVPTMPW